MADEIEYEGLPANAGLGVSVKWFVSPKFWLIFPLNQVNMLAGALVGIFSLLANNYSWGYIEGIPE